MERGGKTAPYYADFMKELKGIYRHSRAGSPNARYALVAISLSSSVFTVLVLLGIGAIFALPAATASFALFFFACRQSKNIRFDKALAAASSANLLIVAMILILFR